MCIVKVYCSMSISTISTLPHPAGAYVLEIHSTTLLASIFFSSRNPSPTTMPCLNPVVSSTRSVASAPEISRMVSKKVSMAEVQKKTTSPPSKSTSPVSKSHFNSAAPTVISFFIALSSASFYISLAFCWQLFQYSLSL